MRVIRNKGVVAIVIVALILSFVTVYTGNMRSVSADDSQAVYRLYNPNTGEHFYTVNEAEYENLQNVGWKDEGVGWYGADYGEPVYRLYNPNAEGGDHYYTLSRGEAEALVSLGWIADNNWEPAFFSFGETNLYVAYNPNAQSGAHNYTTNLSEQNNLLSIGWKYGEIAWKVVSIGYTYVDKTYADENITTDGGGEGSNPGSYRYIYADRTFDDADLEGQTPEVDFSADVVMSGSQSDYEMQFVIAGAREKSGQIGIELHYQAGWDERYAQGRINVTNINFPSDGNSYGQQYYSVNTSAPRINNNQKVRLQIKYYSSGYMQTYVNNVLVGQYKVKLIPDATGTITPTIDDNVDRYILHANSNTQCVISNIKVLRRGDDYTKWGSMNGGGDPQGFNKSSYDISGGTTHSVVSAIY